MAKVYVRTVPGRVARVAPQGRYIPTDNFIGAELTPYLHRLHAVHGDIEIRRDDPVAKRRKADEQVTE